MSAEYSLLIPFLSASPAFARGVEFGTSAYAPMAAGKRIVKGYFQSLNEEQIRLTAHRMGYDVRKLKPWRHEGKRTGWVWIELVLRKTITSEPLCES